MISSRPQVAPSSYKQPAYYVDSKPIAGTGIFNNKTDVQLKRKEEAKPKHAILIGAAIIAGILILSYKLEEKF